MEKNRILAITRGALILLFFYVAGSKLYDFSGFRSELSLQVFPIAFQPVLLIGIPASEFLAVALLAFPGTKIYGFWLSAALTAAFTIYILGALLHFYPKIPCSCGGVLRKMGWKQHFVFNLVFFALSIYGLIQTLKERRSGNQDQ
jgi:hypothetical protein